MTTTQQSVKQINYNERWRTIINEEDFSIFLSEFSDSLANKLIVNWNVGIHIKFPDKETQFNPYINQTYGRY